MTGGLQFGCIPDDTRDPGPCSRGGQKGVLARAWEKIRRCVHPYLGAGIALGASLSGSITPADCSHGGWLGVSGINAGVMGSYGTSFGEGGYATGSFGAGAGDSLFGGIIWTF